MAAAALWLAWAPAARALGPAQELYEVSAKELEATGRPIYLPAVWKYSAGDDAVFAAHGFDDSAWEEIDARFRAGARPADWPGVGWFRLRFRVDADLRGRALGLLIQHMGSSEIYLDGKLLYTLGTVDASPERAVGHVQRQPYLFTFDDRTEHVLAVRYCHHDPQRFEAIGYEVGFRLSIGEANRRISAFRRDMGTNSTFQALFTGVFASFAILHLLLFVFYREAPENLWFALLTATAAAIVYLFLRSYSTHDPNFFPWYERASNAAWLLVCVVSPGFVYGIFGVKKRRSLYAVAVVAGLLLIPGILWPQATRPFILALVFVAFLEMCRSVVQALRRGRPGARIVGLGILVLTAGFTTGLLAGLEIVAETITTFFLIPLYSMCLLVLTMSIHLSRTFARAHRDLRQQLVQVRELSEQKLLQERRAREDEVHHTKLEAEYQRKADELEEARLLQLSMLPERLPELPDLEVAADMHTATEVGGDYYDFDLAGDGTLTIAIGDATGHGMRAGTMVTATKSLFKSMADESDLSRTLTRFTRTIRRMNLHKLSMALTLAKFKDGRLTLAAAGMPPALVYRAGSRTVETHLVEGAPLGSLVGYPYRQIELDLTPGDAVLFMSDGFPERLNHRDEMLGYDQATDAFWKAASTSPQAIIDRLVATGDSWADGLAPKDDMTFVVMKCR